MFQFQPLLEVTQATPLWSYVALWPNSKRSSDRYQTRKEAQVIKLSVAHPMINITQ